MQTMAPPEDALKERFARIDERFDRTDERIVDVGRRVTETAKETDRRITEGREETNRRFDGLSPEMKALRQEMTSLHATVQRGNYTLLAAMLGLIGTILIKGI